MLPLSAATSKAFLKEARSNSSIEESLFSAETMNLMYECLEPLDMSNPQMIQPSAAVCLAKLSAKSEMSFS